MRVLRGTTALEWVHKYHLPLEMEQVKRIDAILLVHSKIAVGYPVDPAYPPPC